MQNHKPQKQNFRNLTSRFAGRISNTKRPKWFVRLIIKLYISIFNIKIENYIVPKKGFKNFNEFFTRKIKNGLRSIQDGIISPVDGFIFDFGETDPDNKIYVKHRHYYIDDLICDDYQDLSSYAVLYLSPSNYHRVHSPFDITINSVSYLPGTLLSVRKKVIYKKDRVYCRNERIVIEGVCEFGKCKIVLVGALLVGKVKLSFDNSLQTNIKKGIYIKRIYEKSINISKAEELGLFEMGSSVIILLEHNCLSKIIKPIHTPIKYGESLLS